MPFNRTLAATVTIVTSILLSACSQTPAGEVSYSGERAAYSEWSCHGEPLLTQFYGARVVVSDGQSSRWLDRGTQVGQVFRSEDHSIRFRESSVVWIAYGESTECEARALPVHWQQAAQQGAGRLHFMAEGAQQRWQFKLQGQRAIIELEEMGEAPVRRELNAGEGDYYLDMWTFNIQTSQDRMRVEIIEGLCRNQIDQIPYPASIQINWNDQVLQGCGRWLAKSGYRP